MSMARKQLLFNSSCAAILTRGAIALSFGCASRPAPAPLPPRSDEPTHASTEGALATKPNAESAPGAPPATSSRGVPFVPPRCAHTPPAPLPLNAPKLTLGKFVNISPPGVNFTDVKSLTQGMTMDPCNPATLYVCIVDENSGIYRSTDGGATWTVLGHFDTPINVRVDPADPLHLYVGDGVRGSTNGFYVSKDGGKTWAMPKGFLDFNKQAGNFDVYHVEPDPTNFSHVLVTFHSPYRDEKDSGVIESFDGGETFEKRPLIPGGAFAGGYNVFFLYDRELKLGDSKTWLFGTQGRGHWRTTNRGETWEKVTDINMQHGGGTLFYTKTGRLYISSAEGVLRSDDNGRSFKKVGPDGGYLSVIGYDSRLFTALHFNARYMTASESNDTSWQPFNDQTFAEGPFQMVIDKDHGILYSAQIRAGVWALKLR